MIILLHSWDNSNHGFSTHKFWLGLPRDFLCSHVITSIIHKIVNDKQLPMLADSEIDRSHLTCWNLHSSFREHVPINSPYFYVDSKATYYKNMAIYLTNKHWWKKNFVFYLHELDMNLNLTLDLIRTFSRSFINNCDCSEQSI